MSNQLPAITSSIAPDLRNFLNRVREAFEDPDGLVTREDLVDSGVFQSNAAGDLEFLEPGEAESCVSPPAPVNLVASGAMTSVVLTWAGVSYNPCYAYTEVWRADTDDLGLAVLIGTATGGMYADAVGSDDSNYYWVRFVNVIDDKGPYNQTAGTLGATAPDLAYVFEQLTEAYGTGSDAPFFQLDSDTTINGVVIAAGTYIKEAKIYNGTITNAKIGDLAVDSAKIAAAAITTAKIANANITTAKIANLAVGAAQIANATITATQIQDAAITNAKIGDVIQSDAYSAGTAGWKIDKNGAMEMNNATFRGTIDGASSASGSRLVIDDDTIEVYDGSTLRVKLGNLA
ncbi:MAG: hypothetical protein QF535_07350 [Anaerolineales bacterium]|nr:hypothetical protein [Anaerolineales bacterium]